MAVIIPRLIHRAVRSLLDRIPLSLAPHPLERYEALVRSFMDSAGPTRFSFVTLDQLLVEGRKQEQASVVLRHDIDTSLCVRQAKHLARIEEKLGIRSSWYFRVDEYQYEVADCRSLIEELVRTGHHVGLHSAPYLENDPADALQKHVARFEVAFGFAPGTWTVHGMNCSTRLKQRRTDFEETLAQKKNATPGSDLSGRAYTRAMGDAHFTRNKNRAFLSRMDFRNALEAVNGEAILVLSHPCYWGEDGCRRPPQEL